MAGQLARTEKRTAAVFFSFFFLACFLCHTHSYAEMPQQAGLTDLLKQLAPSNTNAAQQASAKELPYVLLRRAAARAGLNVGYEVRRYPQHVSIATEYYSRLDAFGARLLPCRPTHATHISLSSHHIVSFSRHKQARSARTRTAQTRRRAR